LKNLEATAEEVVEHYVRAAQVYQLPAKPPGDVVNQLGHRRLNAPTPDVDSALELFALNLRSYPKEPVAWQAMADALFQAGRVNDALDHLDRAIELAETPAKRARLLEQRAVFSRSSIRQGNP